mmetsp:Transcript_27291/g.60138  ORF Transcript_27291/g.60138 Transcript_27291/m.60138 type:complete len:314 (+) Transcript_27291:90-1031(+)|eukprot:CAMPEP_0168234368 /NCGR_PEP_ID=MMETSP0140_2-20121125/18223_1 /TAXON_ID=44445 /ORGANISM="Pseudo-nitzschia australis, Strain 10249 10 AB" /LENGTH=313 /DNA_ID=CAMNT_0008167145 /DNA_START=41 /DNA_END=982 /DNA_ORIENTATION=-
MFCTARHVASRSTTVGRTIAGRNKSFSAPSVPSSLLGGRNGVLRGRNALTRTQSPPSSALRSMTSKAKPSPKSELSSAAAAKTRAGSGKVASGTPYIKDRGPVSWPSLFMVGIAAASVVAYYNIERERRLESAMGRVVSTGKPAIGGPWSLVDLDGKLVTNASFRGKWLLLYFGFARCPDICPSEMLKLARVIDQLKETHPQLASQLVPVFVSVDPARDSLTALREYAKDFHPDYIFLTGSPTQVQEMAKKYRVYVSKAEETEDGDYLVDHSIVVYFHDNKGELSDCFTQSMRPKDISEKIVEKMKTPEGLVA